ncbi:MAG TPA: peptidase [Pirellulaceae bacterium]|jgi:predicted esterase|nr:peptidase [Pirellulaceae bacterium]
MRSVHSSRAAGIAQAFFALAALTAFGAPAFADVFTLRNGMQLTGSPGKISKMGEAAVAADSGGLESKPILLVDDDLRRYFFPMVQLQTVAASPAAPPHGISIRQKTAPAAARRIAGVGDIIEVTNFDETGRRRFRMRSSKGPVDIYQGITEITPLYTKLESLQGQSDVSWDSRIATSSLPRDLIRQVVYRNIDVTNFDDRQRLVRLFLAADRYYDALVELEAMAKDFPEHEDLKDQVVAVKQAAARKLVDEVAQRRDAGQHETVKKIASGFPTEGVAGETLLRLSEMVQAYQKDAERRELVLSSLKTRIAAVEEADARTRLENLLAELEADLRTESLPRLADYLRLEGDESLKDHEKIALAVTGWIFGSGEGVNDFELALSALQVRDLVREYLRAADLLTRTTALDEIQRREASRPEYVAKILRAITPPLDLPEQVQGKPGLYALPTPVTAEVTMSYVIQLPPEYDPYRKYPCVVTLGAAGVPPEKQIEWWAGGYDQAGTMRMGQAARNGYIVIAPQYLAEGRGDYEFSALEHAAVVNALRDACCRVSIDTDRVFLSGHSQGATAAWDIAIAHPDLWAGVLPIVPLSHRFITRYAKNAEYMPMYFVTGQLDGDKMTVNGNDFNHYLRNTKHDILIAEYRGRGHESFHDEIQQFFVWMKLHRRDPFPKEFKVATQRPWDNAFWYVEAVALPEQNMIDPFNFPERIFPQAAVIEGKIISDSSLTASASGKNPIVCLAPEMIDFSKRIEINGRPVAVVPDLGLMLEDARLRADRQHPFWAKVEAPRR